MKKLILIFIAFFSLFYWTKPVGDVNLNGKVTITDLVILHRYLEGLDELNAWQRDRADMNQRWKSKRARFNSVTQKVSRLRITLKRVEILAFLIML
jgi:hypothetical protein